MTNNQAIGVFDSGLGGLTVLSALHGLLPYESTVYLGDTARLPYGTKSPATIKRYAINSARALLEAQSLKLLVVACNTVSAVALDELEQLFSIPVVGVITPTVQAIAHNPDIQSVAVLGTRATIGSKAYEKALKKAGFEGTIHTQACPLFVPLVEEGLTTGPIAEMIASHYASEIPASDTVILGCTHYPLLLPTLKNVLAPRLGFLDSGVVTAKAVQDILQANNSLVAGRSDKALRRYLVTEAPGRFETLFEYFLGYAVGDAPIEQVDIRDE